MTFASLDDAISFIILIHSNFIQILSLHEKVFKLQNLTNHHCPLQNKIIFKKRNLINVFDSVYFSTSIDEIHLMDEQHFLHRFDKYMQLRTNAINNCTITASRLINVSLERFCAWAIFVLLFWCLFQFGNRMYLNHINSSNGILR